jgi:hypothetical protein
VSLAEPSSKRYRYKEATCMEMQIHILIKMGKLFVYKIIAVKYEHFE